MNSRIGMCVACVAFVSAFGEAVAQDTGAADAETNAARSAVEAPSGETDPASDAPAVEESAILPSAEEHEASQAPSMSLDCSEDPDACVTPLDGPSDGPTLSTPDASETTADDDGAVTADP